LPYPAIFRCRFHRAKLAWVKKTEPGIFDAVDKVLLPKDYIRYRMTGEFAPICGLVGTYWLDVAKRQWSDELLGFDMRRDQMPPSTREARRPGRLTPAIAKAWGNAETPVVAAAAATMRHRLWHRCRH